MELTRVPTSTAPAALGWSLSCLELLASAAEPYEGSRGLEGRVLSRRGARPSPRRLRSSKSGCSKEKVGDEGGGEHGESEQKSE